MGRVQAATDTFKELAAIYLSLLLISAAIYMQLEGRTFLESFYWAGTTATSTGYGDIIPKTAGGQALAFVLMHISIFGVAPLIIVRLVDRLNENRDAFTHEEQLLILETIVRVEEAVKRLEQKAIDAEAAPLAD
ncbi:MAG: potassium channel family protein [Pseudomonadota bacterium]|nr:potassium channel family protein [Pseudomonadota bacterium]